ncbi:MAG: nucleotidyltransferase domain-containing protein [Mycobacterium sp.]|nr:nucleotidyltransferase domain-containing protein [Mycobacterium sp.]MDZ7885543.1 nucleotidyltransferase domain-containing protein [Mycobacterium sp.]
MDQVERRIEDAVETLRSLGAVFAYLHGSRAAGTAAPDADVDIAAYFPGAAPKSFEVLLPPRVDLVVLNDAPLELCGRIAVSGVLLFDSDPSVRVRWEATTRKVYFDELPRMQRAHSEFAETVLHRRGG